MTSNKARPISGSLLARNTLWNLLGMAAPMLVAVVAIPLLISGMGKERFGLLTIIWMGVGYFSLFDLGLGRALTKMVSERLGSGQTRELAPLIWTTFSLLTILGVLGAIALYWISPPLVTGLLNTPPELHEEGVAAFRILGAGLPLVIITTGLIGLLEAHQRFGLIAAIRIPLGALTFAGPLASLQFTPSLAWATSVLLLGRALALASYFWAASRIRNELRRPQAPQRQLLRPLLSFGGWLTVTNIISPLMTYLDRFFIGALLSLSAVTYYVTPYEVLSRLQLIPHAIMGVLFPAMAAVHGSGDQKRLSTIYSQSAKITYWSMLPITSGVFLLAPELLSLWLGEEFSEEATPVVRLLAAGWTINMLARPASTILQSSGRPDLSAKAHMMELLPYLALLWWLTTNYGIVGTAASWVLRIIADTIILNVLTARHIPSLEKSARRSCLTIATTSIMFLSFHFAETMTARLIILMSVILYTTHTGASQIKSMLRMRLS